MAKTYTVTVKLKCWKAHECVGCGNVFRYLFSRDVQGTAATVEKAQRAADANVERALKEDVNLHPCPLCGRIQPDMIGRPRASRHSRVMWIFALLLVVLVILGGTHAIGGFTYAVAGLAAAATVGLASLIQFLIASGNPNSDAAGNLAKAERAMDSGVLESTLNGDLERAREFPPRHPFNPGHIIGLAMMFASAAAFSAPGVVKTISGWPSSDGIPEVVGPGETVKVYFDHRIDCVKGFWHGVATATIDDDGVGLPEKRIHAESNQASWGNDIRAKSSANQNHPNIWATFTIPSEERLVGKQLSVSVALTITYPRAEGNTFNNHTEQGQQKFTINVAPAGAQATYESTFWFGMIAGGVLFLIGGFILVRLSKSLAATANPTAVQPIENAPPPVDPNLKFHPGI